VRSRGGDGAQGRFDVSQHPLHPLLQRRILALHRPAVAHLLLQVHTSVSGTHDIRTRTTHANARTHDTRTHARLWLQCDEYLVEMHDGLPLVDGDVDFVALHAHVLLAKVALDDSLDGPLSRVDITRRRCRVWYVRCLDHVLCVPRVCVCAPLKLRGLDSSCRSTARTESASMSFTGLAFHSSVTDEVDVCSTDTAS